MKRIKNLDLFRALAISMVIYYHIAQMFFGSDVPIYLWHWGKYGVELFFVLSGFLIAGLYYKKAERPNLFKFWLLRFFRTYPPYIIALLISYLSVAIFRNQNFDFTYIFFGQNYYDKIPYFLVSWSLCIEEHFYLIFPFIVLCMERTKCSKMIQFLFWLLICCIPVFLRWKLGNPAHSNFGYYDTATWFKFEGISLGCLLAFVVYRLNYKFKFSNFTGFLTLISVFSLLALNVKYNNSCYSYTLGYFLFNISLFFLLALFYFSPEFKVTRLKFIYPLAMMAYSLYLTHALVINAVTIISSKFSLPLFITLPFCLAVIVLAGNIFYYVIEKRAIIFRDRFFDYKIGLKFHNYLVPGRKRSNAIVSIVSKKNRG